MPRPEYIRQQIAKLTSTLVGLSLCDHQNFPSVHNRGQGLCEIGVGEHGHVSTALKNVSYQSIYVELERNKKYNLRMIDGALVYMMYRFRHNSDRSAPLGIFSFPFLGRVPK